MRLKPKAKQRNLFVQILNDVGLLGLMTFVVYSRVIVDRRFQLHV